MKRVTDVTERLSSDLGVYLLSGAFSLLVFFVALVGLAYFVPGGLGRRRLAGFVVGFLLFVATYFIAMWIYREIGAREET
ncbi:hypothetical protein ACERIT_14500 [Halopenitus sp. H-Gu1]|uniref:hypothetical protein n=1 Tax=Halopenitus sp. H-Gu1 TaxID=3242697 RepID=UPI00359DBF14